MDPLAWYFLVRARNFAVPNLRFQLLHVPVFYQINLCVDESQGLIDSGRSPRRLLVRSG